MKTRKNAGRPSRAKDPAAPIFEAARHGEGSHDTGRVVTRLSEVVYHGAAAIDQNFVRVGAVEIHLWRIGFGNSGCL